MRLRKESPVPPRDLAMQHLDASSRSSRTPQSTFTAEANTDVIFLHKERKVSATSAAQIENHSGNPRRHHALCARKDARGWLVWCKRKSGMKARNVMRAILIRVAEFATELCKAYISSHGV